jgi:hypothetical protein
LTRGSIFYIVLVVIKTTYSMAEQNNNDFTNFNPNTNNPESFDPNQINQDFTNIPINNNTPNFDPGNLGAGFPVTPEPEFNQNFNPNSQTSTSPNFAENLNPVNNFADSGFDAPNNNSQSFSNTYTEPVNTNEPTPVAGTGTTFSQTKTGNKNFLIIAIAAGVILLLLAGVLIFINSRPSIKNESPVEITNSIDENADQNNNPQEDSEQEFVDNSKTGGDDTLASQSRIYNETEIPNEWLLQKFRPPAIDGEGNCINISQCGSSADPDQDGAENLDEYNFQLDPLVNDTDKDGVADGDELFIYYSKPSEDDSDSDTYIDGQELVNCFNPNLLTVQFDGEELSTIATNISLQKLHAPTIKSITEAGGTPEDINKNGLVIAKCKAKPAPVNTVDAEIKDNSNSNTSIPTSNSNIVN